MEQNAEQLRKLMEAVEVNEDDKSEWSTESKSRKDADLDSLTDFVDSKSDDAGRIGPFASFKLADMAYDLGYKFGEESASKSINEEMDFAEDDMPGLYQAMHHAVYNATTELDRYRHIIKDKEVGADFERVMEALDALRRGKLHTLRSGS